MSIQFYTIFNTIVILGRFKVNGVGYCFKTNASKTREEALKKFFTGYEDAIALSPSKRLKVITEYNKMPYSYMYEKKDYSFNLRFARAVKDLIKSPYQTCLFN